jgi:hypothetical protein
MSTFTKFFDKLRGLAPEADIALEILAVAQSITGVGGPSAATGIKVLRSAFAALDSHAAGHLTHEELMQHLVQAHEQLASIRAIEDAELAAKTPTPRTVRP